MDNFPECFPCMVSMLSAECEKCMTTRKFNVSLYKKDRPDKKNRILFRNLTWPEASAKCDEINLALGHFIDGEEILVGSCNYIAMFDE